LKPYLMGIDLGTSACKTVIFSLDGRKISEAQKEYPIYHPKPRWAEQKPADWWHAASWTIRESLSQANLRGDEVAAVSVTSQREAVVPVGKEGKELYNSIIWLDNRTGSQVLKISTGFVFFMRERLHRLQANRHDGNRLFYGF